MKFITRMASFAVFLLSLVTVLVINIESSDDKDNADICIDLIYEESEYVDIVMNGATKYSIIFSSSDSMTEDLDVANKLRRMFRSLGANLELHSDYVQSPKEYEILIGATNRQLSQELINNIESNSYGNGYVWIIAEKDGKLAYVANCREAFLYGVSDLYALINQEGLTVTKNFYFEGILTEKELEEMREIENQKYVESLKIMNSTFTEEQFGKDSYIPMISEENGYYKTNPKPEPWYYPAQGDHPRYLLNSGNLKNIKAILTYPAYANLSEAFWKYANATPEEHLYGIFPEVEDYRYDSTILAMLEAKALAYLLTGEERYALEAIVGIKNAILTYKYTATLHGDVYHGPSLLMITSAAIYDWCYDYLSESDKWQIIYAVATKLASGLEAGMQYPPYGMTPVSGHGTGPQFVRDWVTVALAFFDEVPDWRSFVGGRYFAEYLPVANEQFKGGWVSQGTVIYGQLKVHVQIWAAYLIKCATGENVLTDDARLTAYYELSHIRPDDRYFETGDGTRTPEGSSIGFAEFFILAAMYNDPVIFANAKRYSKDFTIFFYEEQGFDTIMTMTPAYQLALASAVDYNGEDSREGLEAIQYFSDIASQMTVRQSWEDSDSIAIMMKIGNRTMANHDLYDHGTFQIYYKGLLAATSGGYRGYGMPSHWFYHQATVAHNGLLIFNPAFADEELVYDATKPVTQRYVNASTYYYSGSQYLRSEATSYDEWVGGKYDMAKTLGAAYEYNADGTPKYAYIAGDITTAYHDATVDYVARRMFTVFTDDSDYPALFFTFDQITSDSETFEKTWLLHVIKEPVVDQENKVATVVNGDGKMLVYSLSDADVMEAIGGQGKAYWINGYYKEDGTYVEGKNCLDDYTTHDNWDSIWGRIQLRSRGNKQTEFFTMMAITDTGNDKDIELEKIESDSVIGVKTLGNIIMFARAEDLNAKEIEFSTQGSGLFRYYITGLETGTWRITVDGVSVATACVVEGESILSFIAPTGNIKATPSSDVVGANGGKIQYNTGGAVLPQNTPYYYVSDEATPLPTDVVRGGDVFLGWYTTPSYDDGTEITEIPAGTTGLVKVYAKWFFSFVDEDFSNTQLNVFESRVEVNGVTYNGLDKAFSSFVTKTDANGINYLEWKEGTADSLICQTSTTENFATMENEEKCASMTFSLSLNEGNIPIASHLRLIAKKNVNGSDIPSTSTIVFNTTSDGKITSSDGKLIAKLSNDTISTIRVLLDFNKGVMRFYSENYEVIHETPIIPPESTGAENAEDFRACLSEYIWYWYGATSNDVTNAAMRIYRMKVVEGDEFSDKYIEQTEGIKYYTFGATLPSNAQKDFNAGSITPLPENMSLDGYVFGGWYTSSNYEESTKVSCVPAGTTGLYKVYAKWYKIFTDEKFADTIIDLGNKATEVNGISYGGNNKPGVSFKTQVDSDGIKYLEWVVGTEDPIISIQNLTNNISTMSSNSISYTLDFSASENTAIPDFELRIIGKKNISGGDVVTHFVFGRIKDGKVYISGNDGKFTEIATISSGSITTVRIVIDFSDGTISAYDENGIQNACVYFAIPKESGAITALQYKQCLQSYLYYMRHDGVQTDDGRSLRIYGIRIEEGNAFIKTDIKADANDIVYDTNGAKLPSDAPKKYDPVSGTELPYLSKDGFMFGGWYTSPEYLENTKVSVVGQGLDKTIYVYAKWHKIFTENDFENTNFFVEETKEIVYDGELGIRVIPEGSMLKTVEDKNGNKYVKISVAKNDALIILQNDTYNLTNMTSDVLSIEMEIFPIIEDLLMETHIKIATSGGTYGQLSVANINPLTGDVTLSGNETPFANVLTEKVALRLSVDFKSGKAYAYNEDGEIISESVLIVPTSLVETLDEWRKVARNYLLYIYMYRSGSSVETPASIGIDNLSVKEGNIYC